MSLKHVRSQNTFVGVAFLRGDPRRMSDQVVMQATWGPFVHSEIFLQRDEDIRFYTACSPLGKGFVPSVRLHGIQTWDNWEIVRVPFVQQGGYEIAYSLILQILAMSLPYNNKDLWQCCVKVMLPFEDDLDCDNLVTWQKSGVFCSQVCLLILRRLARRQAIGLTNDSSPGRGSAVLENLNSRGCSPNTLYNILTALVPPLKKKCETTRACSLDRRRTIRST